MLGAPRHNAINTMEGRQLLRTLAPASVHLIVFDPQYRGVLDHLSYGNEGARQSRRHALPAMDDQVICEFIAEIERVLKPSHHCLLWVDKYALGTGRHLGWLRPPLRVVDLIAWDTGKFGMGVRARGRMQFLLVIQKEPIRAKGCWHSNRIPDGWLEFADYSMHPHAKPLTLLQALIKALTKKRGELVVDPAAGSYATLLAAAACGREFLGCDLVAPSKEMNRGAAL
jgi:site-specific DNA-methyltransferase (adenine-specific)